MNRIFLNLLFSLLLKPALQEQTPSYPRDYFKPPLDIPISLAGNFAELRPNHFHAGLDMRTGKEGFAVHASADGYVSRIKISPVGYGKVVYITHPNGYVTVYGHLNRFHGALADYVKEAQYKDEKFEIEVFPTVNSLLVKQGEIIAFSGNTGSSGGPHLHFEIRDAKTENPINPLLFGMPVPDTVKPIIKQLVLYPMYEASLINGSRVPLRIHPAGVAGKYSASTPSPIHVAGTFAFGIEATDKENNSSGENQVYSVELQIDGKPVYGFELSTFSFAETRFVNAHMDYASHKKNGDYIQRCFLVKGNPLHIYKTDTDSGRIGYASGTKKHLAQFTVKDLNGNTATCMLDYESVPLKETIVLPPPLHSCSTPLELNDEEFRLKIPAHALYENYNFVHGIGKKPIAGAVSGLFTVMDESVPLQEAIAISIKTKKIPPGKTAKAVVVKVEKSGAYTCLGGEWKDDWMTVSTKELGAFTTLLDLSPPKLSLVYPLAGPEARLEKGKQIRLHVSDNLSGVKSYRALLDGKWVLMEYEPKQNLLFIDTHPLNLSDGVHTLVVEAEDGVKNKSSLSLTFTK
jgi:hypothetical protein